MNKRSYKKNNKKVKKSLSKVKKVVKKSKRSKVTRRRRGGAFSSPRSPRSDDWSLMSSPSSPSGSSPSGSPVVVEGSGVPAHLRNSSFISETCPTCEYKYIREPGFVHVCTASRPLGPTLATRIVRGATDVVRPVRNLLRNTDKDLPKGTEMPQVVRDSDTVTYMYPHNRGVWVMGDKPWDETVKNIAPGVYDPVAFKKKNLADTTELMKNFEKLKGGSRKNRKNKRSARRRGGEHPYKRIVRQAKHLQKQPAQQVPPSQTMTAFGLVDKQLKTPNPVYWHPTQHRL